MAYNLKDTLGTVADSKGQSEFSAQWDWKGNYVSSVDEDGYERYSQFSATPDTTAIFAGPARFSAVNETSLKAIGLVDGLSYSSNTQLMRLYEIGSNRAFFTRGKTMNSMNFGMMVADRKNILASLIEQAHKHHKVKLNARGLKAAGAQGADSSVMMNLDSEYFNIPFGVLLVFKTKGSSEHYGGKILSAVYCEYCMFQGYQINLQAQSPIVTENVGIEFDRVVPVAIK